MAGSLTRSFDEFVRDKAEAWATVKHDEFATVEAARGLETNEDGLVGKKVDGFPKFGHGMKKYWPFAPECESVAVTRS